MINFKLFHCEVTYIAFVPLRGCVIDLSRLFAAFTVWLLGVVGGCGLFYGTGKNLIIDVNRDFNAERVRLVNGFLF